MKLIKLGAAALNQTPMDWNSNTEHILRAIKIAKDQQVSVLCLPELCVTGYGCEDAYHSLSLLETAQKIICQEILPETNGIIVCVGLPVNYRNGTFNTVCLISDQKILGFVAKQYLAGDGIYYEQRWFKPWPAGAQTTVELVDGNEYPLGDIFFDISGIRIGCEICEDAWVAQRPGSHLAFRGIDIILNSNASHFAFGKKEIYTRFVLEGSRAFGASYVYSNILGCESGRVIYDGATLIATDGKIVASGKRLSFDDTVVISGVVDIDHTRMVQSKTGSFIPNVKDAELGRIIGKFDFPKNEINITSITTEEESWEKTAHIKEEEFTRVVSLGLFDYLRKSKSQGFVISLSGGADSSATACLVALMIEIGIRELGLRNFLEKLSHINFLNESMNIKQITQALLTCVYQATENSSDITQIAANEVANEIGATFYKIEIETLVKQYIEIFSSVLGKTLNWATDDITLQNIQARVRAPGIWLLANIKKALLLSTSNRSEAAVGYTTMDGDTCGSLCPIGGIDKAFLRNWLRWIQTVGPVGLHSISALSFVNKQQPTAELKPKEYLQTDEADLMPYSLLDEIERSAIRDKKTPTEVFLSLQNKFEDRYSNEQLKNWIIKFFHLWSINQWKRERYAPSFHLDDESLDPKTWCRFPILSGNFEKEINDLRSLHF